MPELPEVEVVRAGLAPAITGATVTAVEVYDERSLKRHRNELGDFIAMLTGSRLSSPVRRGKFLWVPLEVESNSDLSRLGEMALLAHLGMSGQMLLRDEEASDDRHVRVRLWLEHPSHQTLRLDFVDQRIFGSLAIDRLVETADALPAGFGSESPLIPSQASHISRDALDPYLDEPKLLNLLAIKGSEIKRLLLDQQVVSGIGNIYADEALWAARIHPRMLARELTHEQRVMLLGEVRSVLEKALAEGGTSFDAQYVNVNGQAGYFAHSLNAYGRNGQACPRCDTSLVRESFMNRSSHFCPSCQQLNEKA